MSNIKFEQRTCLECHKLFYPRVKNQIYCEFTCTRKRATRVFLQKRRAQKRAKRDLFGFEIAAE